MRTHTHTPAAKAPRKTRSELARFVDADYYGYRDEEDGIIVPLEQEQEKKGVCMGSNSPLESPGSRVGPHENQGTRLGRRARTN